MLQSLIYVDVTIIKEVEHQGEGNGTSNSEQSEESLGWMEYPSKGTIWKILVLLATLLFKYWKKVMVLVILESDGPGDTTKLKSLDVVKYAYHIFKTYKGHIVDHKFYSRGIQDKSKASSRQYKGWKWSF